MNSRLGPRIAAWWDTVLAGETGEPHPIHGDDVSVRLLDGRLEVSGELDSERDRNELVKQALAHVGRGFREVDASRLKVTDHNERPGILDQTLVAAFPDRATAELARKLVLEHSQAAPKRVAIVDRANTGKLRELLPENYLDDARKHLERGEALLIMRVDETGAFRVRGLLEEDTRSKWTIATPPELSVAPAK